jgi:hypothetical protein
MFLVFRRSKTLESSFDGGSYLFDCMVSVDLFEPALSAIVLDDWSGLGFKGPHALGKDGL